VQVCAGALVQVVQVCVRRGAHLAVVNHGEHAERLDRDDAAHLLRRRANLHHVNGVVVAEGAADVGVALDVGVLPRLRQAAVVPEDGAVVQARLALLLVLHDRVALDLGRNLQEVACARGIQVCLRLWAGARRAHLHLLEGHLRDLAHEVVHAVTRLERDLVPRRDGIAVLHAPTQGSVCV
jgi:hypothetical protein